MQPRRNAIAGSCRLTNIHSEKHGTQQQQARRRSDMLSSLPAAMQHTVLLVPLAGQSITVLVSTTLKPLPSLQEARLQVSASEGPSPSTDLQRQLYMRSCSSGAVPSHCGSSVAASNCHHGAGAASCMPDTPSLLDHTQHLTAPQGPAA